MPLHGLGHFWTFFFCVLSSVVRCLAAARWQDGGRAACTVLQRDDHCSVSLAMHLAAGLPLTASMASETFGQ